MPMRNFLVIVVSAVASLACYERATHNRYAAMIVDAMKIIDDHYVDQVDPRRLFQHAMEGMLDGLDKYSSYIGPEAFEEFQRSIEQEFVGIGVMVQGPPEIERLTVASLVYGSPAYRAGLRAGDVIRQINGFETEVMELKKAVVLIRGPAGSHVELTVRHEDQQQDVTMRVRRETIRTDSVLGDTRGADQQWNYFLPDHPRIAYLRIITFGEYTVEELQRVLPFQGHPIDGLILDLRDNSGGLLDAAVEMCDLMLDEGAIVSTRGRHRWDRRDFSARRDTTVLDRRLPVAVMTNRLSASASEIVAAALQDHGRASVVGQRTWGKGTVQNIIEMEAGTSALKLTTARYHRPNGENIHRRPDAKEQDQWGVKPNEGYQVDLDQDEYLEWYKARRQRDVVNGQGSDGPPSAPIQDRQLEKAIEFIQLRISQTR